MNDITRINNHINVDGKIELLLHFRGVKKVASKLTTDYHGQRWSKVFSETLDPDAMKGRFAN